MGQDMAHSKAFLEGYRSQGSVKTCKYRVFSAEWNDWWAGRKFTGQVA